MNKKFVPENMSSNKPQPETKKEIEEKLKKTVEVEVEINSIETENNNVLEILNIIIGMLNLSEVIDVLKRYILEDKEKATEIIVDKPEPKPETPAMPGGGMGGYDF